ncbi:MAG: hypothetical protein M5R36_03210 [Deltaproteobacteria bacterium]|nr:hypothetical protein [Deltaproteobacteria bacterium]
MTHFAAAALIWAAVSSCVGDGREFIPAREPRVALSQSGAVWALPEPGWDALTFLDALPLERRFGTHAAVLQPRPDGRQQRRLRFRNGTLQRRKRRIRHLRRVRAGVRLADVVHRSDVVALAPAPLRGRHE